MQILYINSKQVQDTYSLDALLHCLPNSMKDRAKRYQHVQDAYNFTLGRLLLRQALLKNALPISQLEEIQYGISGKPMLTDLHFSITHSQEWVACAFSTVGAVGLDIEVPQEIRKKHFRHCFSSTEWDEIIADESKHTFYQYWTAKEAVLKATGLGLGHLLDMTLVNFEEAVIKLSSPASISCWKLQHFTLENSIAYCCLCTEQTMAVNLQLLTIETLLK